ncbi:hypothetical protein SDC9_153289 [bioreactor metagenome]|uniref:Uncharacterized protein n=1 Tax=bioreactor metagenome TaxID=1076179 RepID=A0A645EVI8_9ZZZZ
MPDDHAGVCGSDKQTVVDRGNTAGNLFRQQSAGDQAEAPVQPAADGGDESGDDDGGLVVVRQTRDFFKNLLADRRLRERCAEDDDQGHLH